MNLKTNIDKLYHTMPPKSSRPQYEQMDQITHIHERSDMYVGASTRQLERNEYVVKVAGDAANQADNPVIYKKDHIKYSPALLRVFVEALSNAIDNVWRSAQAKTHCTKIKVDLDPVTGRTTIWNDGLAIPIEVHEKSGLYNPELIFGHLLTSSNYDDGEERMTSGRNGLGIKLTNVFSSEFTVKAYDPTTHSLFQKTWRNNMRDSEKHKITHPKTKSGYTEVSWIPDFEKFKMVAYDHDILSVIYCQVLNAAMVTKIPIWLNGKKIHFKTLLEYAKCFDGAADQCAKKQFIGMTSKDTEIVLCCLNDGTESSQSAQSQQDFEHIAFVNGVNNKDGGVHVDQWSEEIFRPVVTKLNKPGKPQITIKDVKKHFRMFCNTQIANPKFSSQSKTRFVGPAVTVAVESKHINAIMKWDCIELIRDVIRSKELLSLKKTEKKSKVFKKIIGYDPANNAGGKNAKGCTLILCEGLSAKTYAVTGIDVGVGVDEQHKRGRDWFGIYPLRGKLLNVRNASTQSTTGNKEITDMIQALGLRHGVDYQDDTNYNQLNYGKLMIMTDADVDGTHIKGLILNFIHHLFPTLLKRKDPFITSMQTPIVKVFIGKSPLTFYTEEDFCNYMETRDPVNRSKLRVKYYKGLGTSSDQEVRETFGKKLVDFIEGPCCDLSINKAFNGKNANDRKSWLEHYTPGLIEQYSCLDPLCSIPVDEFIDRDLIKFSINDCARSLPHVVDGLKNSHRKILYASFLKPLSDTPGGASVKVAQFSGYIAERTNYHHGEQCLMGTIIGMAQDFPGSNNAPPLVRDGQFGTRSCGGKDAASPRYIFTKLQPYTRTLYPKDDDILLTNVVDDGDVVEPQFYVPILPNILINGCTAGIGTGWSCSVPKYNPLDLIKCVKIWLVEKTILEKTEEGTVSLIPELTPWYHGYTGIIKKVSDQKYESFGHFEKSKVRQQTIVSVTELPIGLWTEKFKEHLEDLLEQKKIKGMKNYSKPDSVSFEIIESPEFELTVETLKLRTSIGLTNMVLFDRHEKIHRFDTVDEIIEYFCPIRYEFYIKRKKHQLAAMKEALVWLTNKRRFLSEIMDDTLVIHKRSEKQIIDNLVKSRYASAGDQDEPNFDYLLNMNIRSMSQDRINKLQKEIDQLDTNIADLLATDESTLWIRDLDRFETQYKVFLNDKSKK